MEVMGDKLSAKQAVKSYNVPLVPGVDEAISDVMAAKKIAAEVGFVNEKSFMRTFKAWTGQTPDEFRTNAKQPCS